MFLFKHLTWVRSVAALAAALLLPLSAEAGVQDDMVALAREASGSPGLAAAVITSGSIDVYASGLRRVGSRARVAKDDFFAIGSDAKAMLGTLIAQEVEAGRLRWDMTIEEVLPEVMATARPEYRTVTITQLLDHRSGLLPLATLPDLAGVPRLDGPVIAQRRKFARWVLRQAPVVAPGTTGVYSNAGYVVAAAMLERVTGRSYEELLQRRLLAPIGICARFGWPGAGDRKNAPWGHMLVDGRLVAVDPDDPESHVPEWMNPAGNLSLSTRDFARFVQLHLRGLRGTSTYLDPSTFRQLHTPAEGYLYAYGWAVIEQDGRQISFHEGNSSLFYAFMIIDPENDIAAVVVANADTPQVAGAAASLAIGLMQAKLQP
jgi:CubicO group peptidase (beta-lactamase class C family)